MPARRWVRAGHIAGGVLVLVWIWSPLRDTGWALLPAQLVLTTLTVSGAVMWPLPRLLAARRAARRRSATGA